MFGSFRRRFTLASFSINLRPHLNSQHLNPTHFHFPHSNVNPSYHLQTLTIPFNPPQFPIFCSPFSASLTQNSGKDEKEEEEEEKEEEDDDGKNPRGDDDDDENPRGKSGILCPDMSTILVILLEKGNSKPQVRILLEQCGVIPSTHLVVEILSRVRNEWESAFTFFLWATKQPNYVPSLREYHSMISILAKARKFDTAWGLISEMRGENGKRKSLVTPKTLSILIRRYCAIHEVGKAINTFYAHKLFKFEVGMEEFHDFLSALCRYKNVRDAEHFLFCNERVFPVNTKSFNIILNGWCNIVCNPHEAKRIWREMSERGVLYDVISYSSMISCSSKFGKLNEVLKLFNQMKALGVCPDRKVYNAVIHALAKGRLVKDARNLLKTMEEEGISPNAATYNSLIKPLCSACELDEVQEVFHEMLHRGMSPTVRTYHAVFQILRSGDKVFDLLEKMNKVDCCPNNDTYTMLIRKFCRWRQLDNVFKLWGEMSKTGGPDQSSYVAMIHGLFLNGKLEEAHKYYEEMKEKRFLPEPKLEEMLQSWALGSSKQVANLQIID